MESVKNTAGRWERSYTDPRGEKLLEDMPRGGDILHDIPRGG